MLFEKKTKSNKETKPTCMFNVKDSTGYCIEDIGHWFDIHLVKCSSWVLM